ncbi:phosphotransferase family protein [Haliangium ochraceum]|uniref:Aminoglycoside phosphotransferase n=1 Tax=Haliangium ochraceum (strain DSM 14365 / JCM 11303 / SMP-2) TaxID=502025 RepID=D0LG07_HALO1|nr:phosphotransferase family protein [Haliangium ochraceum]ACY14609.1 aminoglycoside phosphotransferase [Haliangium ochraceum DSM 14365]
MAHTTDDPRPVRSGEELDAERLRAYLLAHLPKPEGDADSDAELAIEQFPGGHSNLTYLIRFGGREYVLRRPPFGSKVKSAHDMGREFRVLSKLAPVYEKAPRPALHCQDSEVIGAEFYLMERLRGVIVRKDPPADMGIDEGLARRMSEAVVGTLAELHAVDYQAAGLGDFGKPDGYVARQVSGWRKRYEGSQTDDIAAVVEVADWLSDNQPKSGAPALIHNDFKFDNLVLDPADLTRVRGVLDWEMSTVGDPLMDLGTTLCYWVEAGDPALMHQIRFGPTHLPGMMTRAELAARYGELSGRDVSDVVFYYVFGLFKTAVVAQQIYYRFHQGLTQDARFAKMIIGVRALAEKARITIAQGTI